jgi:predicted NUDIX family NTP pyrophosphohydrolase
MSQRVSAGILLYRFRDGQPQVFLVHMGGPFWARKDEGAWSIPKGEYGADEDPLAAARREFREETGSPVEGDFLPLSPIRQAGGKLVTAWAVEGDIDADHIVSNTYRVESPRGSGRWRTYPEVDRGAWFTFSEAAAKMLASQRPLLDELARLL